MEKASNNSKKIRSCNPQIFLIFFVLIVILAFSFAFYSQTIHNDNSAEPTPTPTQTPNPTYVPGQQNFSSSGYIYVTGVKIFGGELQGNSMQFNTLYIGDSKKVSFYVQSASNVPIDLSFSVSEWSPPGIESFLNLSWDYNGLPLKSNQTILLTITLTSSFSDDFANYLINNNVTTFNFNIHINSTKH